MIEYLKGKKVYILAACAVAYAIGGLATGHLDLQTAITILYSSGVMGAFRGAIAHHQDMVNKAINTLVDINQAQQAVKAAPVQP